MKFCRRRKAPVRVPLPTKQMKMEAAETLLQLSYATPSSVLEPVEVEYSQSSSNVASQESCDTQHTATQTVLLIQHSTTQTGTSSCHRATQTNAHCSELTRLKLEHNILAAKLKREHKTQPLQSYFGLHKIRNDKLMKFYTGLTHAQFNHLFNSLGNCVNSLVYWRGSGTIKSKRQCYSKGARTKLLPQDQLFLTLIRLRLALLHQDLAFRFGISLTTVSVIVSTWVQLLYKQLSVLKLMMLPSREIMRKITPPCFKSFKNVKVIVDCFEIFTEMTSNFEEQGNLYSSYKHHCTFKVLIGIAPNGTIIFVSDAYEGAISDKEIFVQSQLAQRLIPGDMVMADRGFVIKDHLFDHGLSLNIPPFLMGRERLTPQEEMQAKRIARVRIHVERAIERVRKFKILSHLLPLSLKRLVSQIVFVVGCLVNYQEPLVR
jgi:hypothetical protein